MPTSAPPRRLFLSGHSLTGGAYPQLLPHTVGGPALHVEARNLPGSTIATRIGQGLLDDLRRGPPFDMLIVTEQHTLLGNIVWNDTLAHLKKVHDNFIAGNAQGRSFLYASWLTVDDLDDPARWIALEAAMAPVWDCVALRINRSLADEGRADRMQVIPAAAALASLAERATAPQGVAGLTMASNRATMRRLFTDDVHPTDLASWFVALVTEASIYRRPPAAAWTPPGVSARLAAQLRSLAWQFASRQAQAKAMTAAECRRHVDRIAVPLYLAYQRDTHWRRRGALLAGLKWLRHRAEWKIFFSRW